MSERADAKLFTPGPITTSRTVKAAMQRDLGSRDTLFTDMVRDVRRRLVALGGVNETDYTAVPMQGSGTFGLESVLSSTVPRDGKLLAIVNGAYGRRMLQMAEILQISTVALDGAEDRTPAPADVDALLADDPAITHVSVVHCETTTGIINPVTEIGEIVARRECRYIVDAMSSFGAVPLNLGDAHVDYLVSSANKCIEGVPGFSFVIARRDALSSTAGQARSLSLDLCAQHNSLEATGQFRFTPPTHALCAFDRALQELEEEGGIEGRARRYHSNHEVLVTGMRELGFAEFLAPEDQSYIITSFRCPDATNFGFDDFYARLKDRDFLIYPGKVSDADCFRIGTIGRIFPDDVRTLLVAIGEVLTEMGVELRQADAMIKEQS